MYNVAMCYGDVQEETSVVMRLNGVDGGEYAS